jgi:inner membrane transporter RhtA
MAADCKRGCGVWILEASMAAIRSTGHRRKANRDRIRFRAGHHERLLLSGDHRLPLGTVGSIEFLGPIALAAFGVRTMRNLAALLFACGGVFLLTSVRISGEPIGYVFAFANCGLFILYVLLGHRIAATGGRRGVERLAMAMLIASIVVTPIGLRSALGSLLDPKLLLAGVGVGICSSVIPYICDQFAMARLSKATFALMLSLLPATACLVGIVVLRQVPSLSELAGVGGVIAGVALKRSADD